MQQRTFSRCIRKEEQGQGIVEYGLIVGLISIVAIAAFMALGPQMEQMFERSASAHNLEEAGMMTSEALYD